MEVTENTSEGMMKKVCVFCETWATGGIEAFLCRLLSAMDKTDLQIDLVVVKLDQDSVFTPELEKTGIRILQLSGSKFRWLSNIKKFQKILKEEKYDVVHLNAFQGLQLLYLWVAKCAGVPVRIAHSHGSDLRKSPVRWCKLLLHRMGKALFERAATVHWACSRQAAEFLFQQGSSGKVLPNGIDTERFRFSAERRDAVRAELGLTDRFVIGCVGRLQYDKNQSFLLDVMAELLPKRPESMLLLVGDGPAREELQEKAKNLGVAERVIFYGVSERPEELLWAMDAFAFPSLSEGLGIVAVEAQAAGLPVIASEHIPEEAKLTELFRRVPFTDGAAAWGRALTEPVKLHRTDAADAIQRTGFEITDVAECVRSAYMRE